MDRPMHRRAFGKASAALGVVSLPLLGAVSRPCIAEAAEAPDALPMLDVRPYQLMCVVCRIGRGLTDDLGNERLSEILAAVRNEPIRPVRLRCHSDSVYRYQNPGRGDDTPEGDLFNEKRDLDIIQKLGLAPGDTRPAIDMFERLLKSVPTAMAICGYQTTTSEAWRGCARAALGDYEKGRTLGIRAIIPPREDKDKAQAKETSVEAIQQADVLLIRPHHLMCMSCFHGGKAELAPIVEDNLYEAIDAVQKSPAIPIKLVRGCCVICPPCSHYDPESTLCIGGRSMALRDQKKDLDVLQKLGLEYGATLPAKELFALLYERIPSTRLVCAWGDGEARSPEWSVCGDPEGREPYEKAREAMLGIVDSSGSGHAPRLLEPGR